jgi:hypothetical protein
MLFYISMSKTGTRVHGYTGTFELKTCTLVHLFFYFFSFCSLPLSIFIIYYIYIIIYI